ncbi:hypothetical protein FQN50_006642 [Emmonsiellopsis sp. PD_5]|nr:hypothetical protein FQN50_006642 [Emmonsiellopsis sp. PD_5]
MAGSNEEAFGSPTDLPGVRHRRHGSSLESGMAGLQLEGNSGDKNNQNSPKFLLKRPLTSDSAISTASSFAEEQQAAAGTNAQFRENWARVYWKDLRKPGTPWAFKVLLIVRTD